MNFRSSFSSLILMRGEQYYRMKRVGEAAVSRHGNITQVSAIVRGSYSYRTVCSFRDGRLIDAGCTCSFGRGGSLCKHAAALCVKIEKENLLPSPASSFTPGQEERVDPFPEKRDGKYRLFDLHRATKDLFITRRLLNEAERVRAEDAPCVTPENEGIPSVRAASASAEIRLGPDRLTACCCRVYSCPSNYFGIISKNGRKTPCPHMLSVLLEVRDYLDRHENEIDSTSREAENMLHAFALSSPAVDEGSIRLQPRLICGRSGFGLGFKAGRGRMFAVQNIADFLNKTDSGLDIALGRCDSFNSRSSSFDADSLPLLAMMREGAGAALHFVRTAGGDPSPSLRNFSSFPLTGSAADRIYDYLTEHPGEYRNARDEKKAVKITSGAPRRPEITIEMKTDSDGNTVHGVEVSGQLPPLLEGERRIYCVAEDTKAALLCPVPDDDGEVIRRLMRLSGPDGFSWRVGRRHLSDFYRTVLPVLRGVAEIRDAAEDAEKLLPEEPHFRFYLDMEDKIPACCPLVDYGTSSYDPADEDRDAAQRDVAREDSAVRTVRNYLPVCVPEKKIFTQEADNPDALFRLLSEGVPALTELGDVFMTDRLRSIGIRKAPKVRLGVSVESDLLNLKAGIEGVDDKDLAGVIDSYRKKKKYHRLQSGEFLPLDDSVRELSGMTEALHISPRELARGNVTVPAYRALYLDRVLEDNEKLSAARDASFRHLIRNFKTVRESDHEAPASLRDMLRPYQVLGYKWLRNLSDCNFGGILADDMGLGKTLQVIAVMLAEKEEGTEGTSLVVCPASVVYNWKEECARFAPALRTEVLAGTPAERKLILGNADGYDVLITSYDLLKRDAGLMKDKQFLYQILDEAQFIKNHSTEAAKAVKTVKAKHRFALTGTPIENRLSELWSIFDFLMPGFLYAYETFRNELETPIVKKGDAEAAKRLRRMCAPFILRRLKEDVLKELPEKLEEVRYARMEGEQERVYMSEALRLKKMLEESSEDSLNRSRLTILRELTRLRQLCCDPSLLLEDYAGPSAKREACLDLIRSAVDGGHRVLLFSQFTSMLSLIEKDLSDSGFGYYKIEGETPKKERLDLAKRFNEGAVPVFLISLKAGGTGLNLTGADAVIHYDPWWNIAAQNQATDRAHRIGQTRKVSVFKLIVKDSIEEKILKLQESKKALADEILSGEPSGGISGMTKEELLELLS